jgi:uncharacterized protein YbjQ (UPF0145 family)
MFTCIFGGIPWYVIVADDPVIPLWLRIAIFALLGGILVVLGTVAIEQRKILSADDMLTPQEPGNTLLLSSTEQLPGEIIKEALGMVQGHTIYAIWLGNDLSALVRLILGGELKEYTELMGKARALATRRMVEQAEELGADAIINVRYTTNSVIGSAAELLAFGTAVKLGKHA